MWFRRKSKRPDRVVRMWLRNAWPRLILPFLVSLKRFLAPECVFSFILAILVSS